MPHEYGHAQRTPICAFSKKQGQHCEGGCQTHLTACWNSAKVKWSMTWRMRSWTLSLFAAFVSDCWKTARKAGRLKRYIGLIVAMSMRAKYSSAAWAAAGL